jgi:L-threonylcarbamoyladenylate synthase
MNAFETDLEICLSVLQRGGIILYPTDTIWGIGCDATNTMAVQKIIELKNRPGSKSFVVLVTSEQEVLQYVSAIDTAVFEYINHSHKPTTVIYEGAKGLADPVIAEDGSVAIRICKEKFCIDLIKRFGKPIVSTSANSSGMPSPVSFSTIEDKIKSGVDYIVKYKQNDQSPSLPSSIIRWEEGRVEVIRS